ncbi:gliding motility protein [Pelobium manganitolerans]|uniref:Gliding motility protein n=1 Tax=Pelobium manganitolerans TaxID=1842495 RepID=A0A419S4E3_9SPHI|nr:outer membrane lipoprotein carrier protein LolA [Pelobium manganitolerans]RKD14523.1 gliding motility protein [Pelobium manganitolerans]
MKKSSISLFVAFLFVSLSAVAQSDPEAKAILAGVSKKYRSYDVVKVDFVYSIKSPQANISQSQSGVLYAKSKSNKYKVIIGGQELISDGKVQWTYLKQDKEVQVSEIDNSPNSLNPAKIFTMYEKGFKYVYLGETTIGGRRYQNVELAPLQNRSFSKVKLRIDKVNKQLSNIVVYDKNGNVYTYQIKTFTPNVKVSDAFFTFDAKAHPGVDVVDLR